MKSGTPRQPPEGKHVAETQEQAASRSVSCDLCGESGYVSGYLPLEESREEKFICEGCGVEIAEHFAHLSEKLEYSEL